MPTRCRRLATQTPSPTWPRHSHLRRTRRGCECLGTDGGNPPSESAASCSGVASASERPWANTTAAPRKLATDSVGGFPPTALGIRRFAGTRNGECRGSGKTFDTVIPSRRLRLQDRHQAVVDPLVLPDRPTSVAF